MEENKFMHIEEHSKQRVVSFEVNTRAPEEMAGNLLRKWGVENLTDYASRRCIGYAPKGHHSNGESHEPNEDIGSHEYVIQMFLHEEEGKEDYFYGAKVCEGPKGLFLVGDVALNQFHDDGTLDIGSSMQIAGSAMMEFLNDTKEYELDLLHRAYREEQVFSKEWWENEAIKDEGVIGFKLWLPIREQSKKEKTKSIKSESMK